MQHDTRGPIEAASAEALRALIARNSRLQLLRSPAARRLVYALLVIATIAALAAWLIAVLAPGGFGLIDLVLLVSFLIYVPWLAIAFWNSAIGFVLLHTTPNALAAVVPPLARARSDDPITARCAVAMTLRNEDPTRPLAHLRTVMRAVGATAEADRFDCFVLSDSTDAGVIAAEEQAIAAWCADAGAGRIAYRRRDRNVGFKGGNVRDFCEHTGRDYEFLLLLDIDSLMTAATVLCMVRVMQASPTLGILQSFAVGLPSASLFARIYQFGHRHAMRCFAMGAGWWQGDCCQFWGHNCVIRIAPYREHCRLPILSGPPPFGGHIICHDQVEAALMRRAGFEVRFIPAETGSFEGNPPGAPDFVARNSRWCLGNLQNLRLLFARGLAPTTRFHLAFMAQKFFGAAAIVLFAVCAATAAATWPADVAFPVGLALGLYLVFFALFLSPRLISLADSAMRHRKDFGGVPRLLLGGLTEIVFTLLLTPPSMFGAAYFMVALLADRSVGWNAQRRDAYRLSWRAAARYFWPATLFGAVLLALIAVTAPGAIPWFMPFLAGLLLAAPFGVLTSSRRLGDWAARCKLCGIPEEFNPPPEVLAIWPLLMKSR